MQVPHHLLPKNLVQPHCPCGVADHCAAAQCSHHLLLLPYTDPTCDNDYLAISPMPNTTVNPLHDCKFCIQTIIARPRNMFLHGLGLPSCDSMCKMLQPFSPCSSAVVNKIINTMICTHSLTQIVPWGSLQCNFKI